MPFEHAIATLADIPQITDVAVAALASNPIFHLIKANCSTADVKKICVLQYTQAFKTPGYHFFKIVDTDKEIVAFCRWGFPHAGEVKGPVEQTSGPVPTGYNEIPLRNLREKQAEGRAKYLNEETDYIVSMLAVDPFYQRKGLGKLLLQHGLSLADRDGAKIYVEASDMGLGLYSSLGFEKVGDFTIDLKSQGGERDEFVPCLVRQPKMQP